jgi:hypothetical protein
MLDTLREISVLVAVKFLRETANINRVVKLKLAPVYWARRVDMSSP